MWTMEDLMSWNLYISCQKDEEQSGKGHLFKKRELFLWRSSCLQDKTYLQQSCYTRIKHAMNHSGHELILSKYLW